MTKRTMEMLLKGKLKAAPLSQRSGSRIPLPRIDAPSLEDLEVALEWPDDPSEEDVEDAMTAWVLDQLESEPRAPGDLVEPDDDVMVNYVTYAGAQVLPMGSKQDVWLDDDVEQFIPGLRASVNGKAVGSTYVLNYKFSPDHPLELFRNQPLTFAVEVCQADVIQPLDCDGDELLARRGADSEEAMLATFRRELVQRSLEDMLYEARSKALFELIDRAPNFSLPSEAIDEEIVAQWNRTEGQTLRDRSLPMDDVVFSKKHWVDHPSLRAEIRSHLTTLIVLGAVGEEYEDQLDRSIVQERIAAMQEESGLDYEALGAELVKHPRELTRLAELVMVEMVTKFICSKATVSIKMPDGTERRVSYPELEAEVAEAIGQVPTGEDTVAEVQTAPAQEEEDPDPES